jgi:ABC-type transport system involved in cytochrome bd biosynthesis fused ATPase/permease subunit
MINITAYIVLWRTSGLEYSLITAFWWGILLVTQHYTTEKTKEFKTKESQYNDERQKLVTDMVVGARTIKAYAWENHYFAKINAARKS